MERNVEFNKRDTFFYDLFLGNKIGQVIVDEQFNIMSAQPCPDCRGDRLSPVVLSVTVGGKNISDFCKLTILQARAFIDSLTLTPSEEKIADSILNEIRARLDFLQKVGLSYLTLSRMVQYRHYLYNTPQTNSLPYLYPHRYGINRPCITNTQCTQAG